MVFVAVLCLVLVVGLLRLGTWQLERRTWKLELIERVTQRLQQPPVALPESQQWAALQPAAFEYLYVKASGYWLTDKTVLAQATTALGSGYWVLTPLALSDGSSLLVNRGFIPGNQRAQWQPPAGENGAPVGNVTIQGLLRKSEPDGGFLRRNDPASQRWFSRDVTAIAQAQQLKSPAPFFLDSGLPDTTLNNNLEARPSSAGPWPREGLTVVRFSNSHLVYAFTWFGLALMVLVAGGFVVRYERRLRLEGHNTPHGNQR
ncbi:MAG: SURF1 family protein [Rhodoferax sp.]|nr:SURF1 family protein [Rhodoferax sp.]MDZ7892050.1 SURF1 family protein [Rhodoferax sp.]